MAFALGEDRDQHVGAGHFFAARGLHVDDGALDDALEASCRFEIFGAVGDQIVQLGFEIGDRTPAQLLQVDVARSHHRRGVLIFDQRQQEMLERSVFVMALVGKRKRTVERLFEAA